MSIAYSLLAMVLCVMAAGNRLGSWEGRAAATPTAKAMNVLNAVSGAKQWVGLRITHNAPAPSIVLMTRSCPHAHARTLERTHAHTK